MLRETKISVHRLSHLFGLSTEKRSNRSSSTKKEKLAPLDSDNPEEEPTEPTRIKGHGRNSHQVYKGADIITVEHSTLKIGNPCPLNCGGRLYEIDSGVVIRVVGSPIAKATRYQQQKLRCALCGERLTASLPQGICPEDRYDETVKAVIALQKYFMGSPFHRMEAFQSMIGMPLPDSVQWELVEQLADGVYPIYKALIRLAAQGKLLHNDDTYVRILSLMKENQEESERKRTGIYTSGIISLVENLQIVLFFSGRQHAGENLDDVLAHRAKGLEKALQMSDALSASKTKNEETIQCNCLAHARRKFVEIEEVWPQECGYVLDLIGEVYKNNAQTKDRAMSDEERLAFHKAHSLEPMKELKTWLDQQIDDHLVEPNSSLGKAIQYCRNHWEKLTRFLSEPGAPLDNNHTERALKIPIRNRKNALFYKTQHGALIGDILMSVIYTCWLNDVNPLDYLIEAQYHRSLILQNPESFLPWNYQSLTQAA